jgi:hypothetical protein
MSSYFRRKHPSRAGGPAWKRLLRNRLFLINLGSLLLVGIVVAAFFLMRGQRHSSVDLGVPDAPSVRDAADAADEPVAKKVPTGLCRVYTRQPGFFVLVDGEPARDAKDEWLTTPCEITLRQGAREITVARAGYRDTSRLVNVKTDAKIDFENVPETDEPGKSVLDAAYIRAATAEPIPLLSLNRGGGKFDPFISGDGRSLYFVSERNGVKGVYRAARQSAFHYFDSTPKLVGNAREYDLPASPTLTADALAVVYTVPRTGEVVCVSRPNAASEFSSRKTLQTRPGTTALRAAQIIRDRDRAWRLYWLESDRGELRGLVATGTAMNVQPDPRSQAGAWERAGTGKTLAPVAEQEFSRGEPFDLRGNPPCMSQDGLRQYVFDGTTLKRATRTPTSEPFGPLETIASFKLQNYSPAPGRRSYSLTDDEQWLFYESGGDLNMIRVFSGRGWGFVNRGRSIPASRTLAASGTPPKKDPSGEPVPKPPAVDPRTLPLAYPAFRKKLVALLQARNYGDARRHITSGLADPRLANDRNLIAWDREDVERTAEFWDDFHKAIGKLKPGDAIEIGPARLKFVSYAKGELVVESSTRRAAKKPLKMPAVELINIVDNQLGLRDAAVQLHIRHFRYFDEAAGRGVALARMKAAGKAAEFQERLAARDAQQAQHEFDRGNPGRALQLAEAVLKDHPKSKAAETARGIIDTAYSLVKWDPVGRRKWQIKVGVFTAAPGSSPGSLLRSPGRFENFELRLEWRSDAPNGQGGVYFRYPGSGSLTESALKIHLADDYNGVVDWLCTGSVFKVAAPTENAVRRRGEWNSLLLRVRGEKIRVVVNGRKVLETTVKNEKIPLKGYVALDGGLGGITYRKTLLVELPATR